MRQNRGATNLARLSDHPGFKAFTDWHWGVKPGKVIEWNDADYPDNLVECGRLVELRVRLPGQRRTTHWHVGEKESAVSHLVYDQDHSAQRLYICSSPNLRNDTRILHWQGSKAKVWDLNDLAATTGGRHATEDYPPIAVKPVGILTHVLYHTWKKGDDDHPDPLKAGSTYIHKCGEESGIMPILAADARGRFWIAGGDYTAPTPGITN